MKNIKVGTIIYDNSRHIERIGVVVTIPSKPFPAGTKLVAGTVINFTYRIKWTESENINDYSENTINRFFDEQRWLIIGALDGS